MVVSGDGMTHYPYILFNQSPEDLRRIGARGGRDGIEIGNPVRRREEKLPPQAVAQ